MKRAWLYPLLIFAAIMVAYANSFSGPFIFDDVLWISANPHIRHLWPLSNALQPPPGAGTGRPSVCLTLALNYALSALEPWSYHLFNLAIHASAALVLFGIVRRTLQGPRLRERFGAHANYLAAAIAILWGVHPMQTESVTYVIQRMESLMGLFLLLTLYCVIRGHDSPRRLWWYAGAVACCALGMGTKEGMAITPIIVLLYDRGGSDVGCLAGLRTGCPHVAEYRQRVLSFPSAESKTIPFNKDGLANVLSFGGQRCRPWQYARKRRKDCQRLSKRHRPNLRKFLPTSLRS